MDDIAARGRRGTRQLAGGAVLIVVLIAAVIVGLVVWLGTPTASTPPPGAAATSSATPFVPPDEPWATATATGTIPPVAMPADLAWSEVAGIALPASGVTGPRDRSGGLARGLAHDPAGAIVAAANIMIRINPQVGPNVYGPTLRDQVVGPDVTALRTRVEDAYETLRDQLGVAYGQPAGRIYATLRGYRLEQYSDLDAWLRLLSEGPDGKGGSLMAAMLLHLRWTGADWAMVAPAGGAFDSSASVVSSADSYTPFPTAPIPR